MDFSLTTVFVNPVGGTLATTGGTSALIPGKMGLYKKSLQAVAVNADTQFVIAQGRQPNEVPQTSKKSDLINKGRIIRYKYFPAVTATQPKIITISDFNAKCGEELTITLRAFSKYLDVSYKNGFTRSFTALTPCCDCGDDPCEQIADKEALVDDFVNQINNSQYADYITASKGGDDTAGWTLILTGDTLAQDPVSANPFNYVYDGYDLVDFYAYAQKEPATTVDQYVDDRCDVFATVTTTQNYSYPRGSSREVRLIEQRHYSYQSGEMKDLNWDADWNPLYATNVAPNIFYNEFVLKFRPVEGNQTWAMHQEIDETVRIFVAQADTAAFKTILDGIVGATDIETEI